MLWRETKMQYFIVLFCLHKETMTSLKYQLQWTTYLAATYKAETTGFADQNPLTTQFYLLLAESPL